MTYSIFPQDDGTRLKSNGSFEWFNETNDSSRSESHQRAIYTISR